MYLAIIALGLFGEAYVRGQLITPGDAAATASQLIVSESLWRLSIASDLLMHVLDVPLIVFFYLLLNPVHHPLAQLMLYICGI
jgi:multisubunit Na+/H+ antiporter MnhG subunit